MVWERCDATLSELLQHEIDHLDGVLALDRQDGHDALLSRKIYLANKDKFDGLVDYSIKATIKT